MLSLQFHTSLKASDTFGSGPEDSQTKMIAFIHQSIAGGKFPSGVVFKGELTDSRINKFLSNIHDKSAKLTKLSGLPTLSRRRIASSPKNSTSAPTKTSSPTTSYQGSEQPKSASPTTPKQSKSSSKAPPLKFGKKGEKLTKAQRELAEKRAQVERKRREAQRRREMEAEADGTCSVEVYFVLLLHKDFGIQSFFILIIF